MHVHRGLDRVGLVSLGVDMVNLAGSGAVNGLFTECYSGDDVFPNSRYDHITSRYEVNKCLTGP